MSNDGKISDGALWATEYRRQYTAVRAALRSLQLQAEHRSSGRISNAVKALSHEFEMVTAAFKALNTPAPQETAPNPNGDYIPATDRRPYGRREFLQELKGDR